MPQYLENEGGRVSYEDSGGDGELVLLLTPMGSLRDVYRFLQPKLVAAGYRVVTMDLRGHGESSVGWPDYSIAAHGRDAIALLAKLGGGPAYVVGNSFSGGSAVWAAAERPDMVKGIVLIGAFVRTVRINPLLTIVMGLMFAGPWGASAWMSYYPRMYPERKPADFAAHVAATKAMMKEPGRFAAFRKIASASKSDSESRLSKVTVPVLVIMGDADPDFPDAAAEARFQADALKAELVMIPGGGHHPQADTPEPVADAMLAFFGKA